MLFNVSFFGTDAHRSITVVVPVASYFICVGIPELNASLVRLVRSAE